MSEAGFMRADLYRSGPRVNASRWYDGCQRPGLRAQTPTALDRTLILSYYKGKFHFPSLSKCKIYADALCSMGWAAAPIFCGKANASEPAYFCNLEGTLPAGGEFVELLLGSESALGRGPQPGSPYCTRTVDDSA